MPGRLSGTTRGVVAAACVAAWAIVAAPAGAAGDVGGFDVGNLGHAIATILIFLGLLVVLGRWAWKPLVAQIQRREQSIAATIENAEKSRRQAEDLLAHYKARLDHADAEAEKVLDEARSEAEQAREQAAAAGREEAEKFLQAAREDLQTARDLAMRDLYASAAEMATDVAERILRKELNADEHERLIAESLEDFKTRAEG